MTTTPPTKTPDAPPARMSDVERYVSRLTEAEQREFRDALAKYTHRLRPPGHPTEPPPLPDGWTKTRVDDSPFPCTIYTSDENTVECYDNGDVVLFGSVYLKATELHGVLSHHLGITPPAASCDHDGVPGDKCVRCTPPAADVRALELEQLLRRWDDYVSKSGCRRTKMCADELRALLTGKGAPL